MEFIKKTKFMKNNRSMHIFLDFKNSFDSVDRRNRLHSKLKFIVIKSYLTVRIHVWELWGTYSYSLPIDFDVVQGLFYF